MRTRRRLRLVVAGVAVGALTVAAAAPAGAQAPLGFQIDKTQALPGEVVTGQVDVDDVAASCTTDLDEFQRQDGAFIQGIEELVEVVFGEPVVDEPTNSEELGAVIIAVIALGAVFDDAIGQQILDQTFVMTFADIATQDLVGEIGNFDPATGEGSVTVPDVAPGLWAVAAACVTPTQDRTTIEAALAEITPIVEGIDFSQFGFSEPFPTIQEILEAALAGGEFTALLQEVGPSLLAPLMEPVGLGIQIFTVITPQQAAADLTADIQALVANGDLTSGYAQGLTRHVVNALRSLDQGDIAATCDQLDGFSDRDIPASVLDPETAGDLTAQVAALQTHLACT